MFDQVPEAERAARLQADPLLHQLYNAHHKLDRQVNQADLGILPLSEEALQALKRQRLHLKEQAMARWAAHQGGGSPPRGDHEGPGQGAAGVWEVAQGGSGAMR